MSIATHIDLDAPSGIVPDHTGGPGPVDFIGSYGTDGQGGPSLGPNRPDITERQDAGAMALPNRNASITAPTCEAPIHSRKNRPATPSQILEVVKGDGLLHGCIRVWASARFIEAYAKTKGRGKGGNGLDYTPLPQLIEGRR